MMSAAKNKDGAWEFLKGYINYPGPPEQPNYISSGNSFFLSNKLNAELAEKAKENQYYIDENGNKHEWGNTQYIGGQNIEVPNNTDADNAVIYDLLDEISTISRSDINIWNIIVEDTDIYFAGKKSAEETAKLIENRVSTYLAESM
jgi:hypothetical protein